MKNKLVSKAIKDVLFIGENQLALLRENFFWVNLLEIKNSKIWEKKKLNYRLWRSSGWSGDTLSQRISCNRSLCGIKECHKKCSLSSSNSEENVNIYSILKGGSAGLYSRSRSYRFQSTLSRNAFRMNDARRWFFLGDRRTANFFGRHKQAEFWFALEISEDISEEKIIYLEG